MAKRNSLKIALEQFQNELTDIQQNPGVVQEDADIAEDAISDDLQDSSDLGEDISALATASESLESLAEALESDLFQNHTASNTEVRSVKMALESYGLEEEAAEVKEGDTKGSIKDRVVKAANAVWDWLRNIGKKIAAWVTDIFTRMTKPVLMYEKRMEAVVKSAGEKLNEVSGDKYAKHLSTGKKLDEGIKDLAEFVTKIATANSYVNAGELLSEVEKNGSADGSAIVKMLNEMQKNFLKAYPEDRDGKFYSHKMIGGVVFMMDIGSESKIHWEHGFDQTKSEKGPESIKNSSDMASLSKAISAGVMSWKQAQASVANMRLTKVADNIARISKTYKGQLNDQAKAALRVMPKMLKSPAIDASLALARTLGAAVSFAEAHVNKTLASRAADAGTSIKNKASGAYDSAKNRFKKDKPEAAKPAEKVTAEEVPQTEAKPMPSNKNKKKK